MTADKKIEEYNELVDEWNTKYPHLETGIFIEQSDVCSNSFERFKVSFLSEEITAKKKLQTTRSLLNSHKKLHYEAGHEDFTRGELAYTIIRIANDILREM